LGWYRVGEGAGLIGAVVGALIVLFVWGIISNRRTV
ncbi:MAG: GlsB/YeaQ/YmgE family stress response membrane protein, partial [Bradyrhizobiaceae bacterium]